MQIKGPLNFGSLLVLVIGFMTTNPSIASACDVPVFRYALERWPAEMFQVIIFHRGPLSASERKIAESLRRSSASELPYVNHTFTAVDLDHEADPRLSALWESLENPPLPRLVLRRPVGRIADQVVWSGRLSSENADVVVDSPVRQKMADQVLDGNSAVWLLLESGREDADDEAAGLIEAELTRLEKALKLPEAVSADSPAGVDPLRVKFSLIRLSRLDPAEQVLIALLMRTEPDLVLYESHPLAFPVYGRARALYALVGDGINPGNIEEACRFLVGPCACEVKWLNPGMDLLTSTDWESGLVGSWVDQVGLASLTDWEKPEWALGMTAGDNQAVAEKSVMLSRPIKRSFLLSLGLVVGLIVLVSLAVAIRAKGKRRR
ncbi:hypothetical protein ACFLT7_02435 [candidate division KSB1 bacterium]